MGKGPTPEEVIRKTQEEAAVADAKATADAKAVKEAEEFGEGEEETITDTTEETQTTETKDDETITEDTTPEPEPEKTKEKPVLVTREEAQKRINRMYARLQGEKEKRINAETRLEMGRGETDENGESKPGLTRAEAEAIWDRKENERKFKESETIVLLRHPDAINEDGTFNINSSFTKAYIDIGRNNPNLAYMVNGPELAEAMVEKQMGFSYKKGLRDGVTSKARVNNTHTGISTVAVVAGKITKLPDFKKRIAKRMNMTEEEYIKYENKIKAGDKRVG